jgi:predicted ferric reductase
MVPEDQVLEHQPGQFLFVTFYSDSLQEHFRAVELRSEGASAVVDIKPGAISHQAHPFSIASAPQDPELKIAVKALGDFTNAVRFLEEGAFARIEGPFGGFSYLNYANRKQVWIAGGIGITPLLSMARHLRSHDYEIDFFYAMETGDQGYFLDELYEIADRYPRVRVVPIIKGKLGHLTAEDILGVSKNLPEKEILICGPPPMMKALEDQFMAVGVPKSQIHYETFAFAG